jgi:hypothetical protein
MADFRWDAAVLRYRAPSGRFVPQTAVRQAVDQVVSAGTQRVASLTQQLTAGAIDVPSWQQQVATELKSLHLATATAAKGGWSEMAPSDFLAVGRQLKVQYTFLRGFAADVASGKQPLDGRAVARAMLYGKAARGTFQETGRTKQRERGGEERRVLSAVESCEDCVSIAAEGWSAIGSLPAIGDSVCRQNCRCEFEYRSAREAA